jgi:hypothetical protein
MSNSWSFYLFNIHSSFLQVWRIVMVSIGNVLNPLELWRVAQRFKMIQKPKLHLRHITNPNCSCILCIKTCKNTFETNKKQVHLQLHNFLHKTCKIHLKQTQTIPLAAADFLHNFSLNYSCKFLLNFLHKKVQKLV